jgi:DNA modification methylase
MDGRLTIDGVKQAYANAGGELDNEALYQAMGLDAEARQEKAPVGRSGQKHNLHARKVRWFQQTLKKAKILERSPGQRGHWRMTPEAMGEQRTATPGIALVAFSTKLGVAIWANWKDVFPLLDEPVHCLITSPPFCLAKPRRYGNPKIEEYTDFITEALEPIVKNLVPGGTLAINVSADIFEPGLPARSLYREKLVIAICERLNLFKLDELIWANNSKAPGPVAWASKERMMLNVGWEPVYLFTNDPRASIADNRRVLKPHTARQQSLIDRGGENRLVENSDGAYRVKPGSYGNQTPGAIPKNVLQMGHACRVQQTVKANARERGLHPHGAPMPLALAEFLVRYLTEPGQLVVDMFGGSLTTGHAAERNGRRWICTEREWDYIAAGASRFA